LHEDLSEIEAFEDPSPLTPVLVAHIVLLPLHSPGQTVREKRGGREGVERENHRAGAAAGARYRLQVHASGQLRLKFAGHSML